MPGFSEYGTHFSDFDMLASRREIRNRKLDESQHLYLKSLGVDSCSVKAKRFGNKLFFKFNMEKNGELATYERKVNLDTLEFVDKKAKLDADVAILGSDFQNDTVQEQERE